MPCPPLCRFVCFPLCVAVPCCSLCGSHVDSVLISSSTWIQCAGSHSSNNYIPSTHPHLDTTTTTTTTTTTITITITFTWHTMPRHKHSHVHHIYFLFALLFASLAPLVACLRVVVLVTLALLASLVLDLTLAPESSLSVRRGVDALTCCSFLLRSHCAFLSLCSSSPRLFVLSLPLCLSC